MKNLLKSFIGTTAALTLAVAVLAPNFSSADQLKGAQLLTKPVATSAAAAAPAMACPTCKTELTSRVDTSARGAIKPAAVSSTHDCGSCSTTVKTEGTGKAAKDVVDHSCTMGSSQMASCCN